MKFTVIILPSADADLTYFRAHEQRIILTGIATHLTYDAMIETKRRKKLDPNRIAPWELRIDHYRIFYEIETTGLIKVVAIGYKDHNDLYIRGKKVDL
jgi:mRNA-degrading endonuclease RelE of RelBE toxin-antitoxin system